MNEKREERLMTILASLVDETIDEAALRELDGLLDGDPDLQLLYKRYMDLHCQLYWNAGTQKSRASTRRYRVWAAAVAGVVGLSLLLIFLLNFGSQELSVAAALSDFEGNVVVTGAGGEPRAASAGMDLRSGDIIESRGGASAATLTFADQSRLMLVSDSSLALSAKSLVLHRGRLMASIQQQSASESFLISAPHANVQVLGTKFTLESLSNQTNLNVLHGRVGVTSPAAQNRVEVSQGEYLVARENQPLVVDKQTPGESGWSEDFEDGLPENWHSGTPETEGLPNGSKGGVRAVKNDYTGKVYYQAITQQEWARGLFPYRDGMHLHVTFKMEHSGWANIFFIARTADIDNHKTFLHKFTIPFGPGSDGVWWKMTVPLSHFQLQTEKGFENIPPSSAELVFGFSFSAPPPDRGLVIDHMTIQPSGPGEVIYERMDLFE